MNLATVKSYLRSLFAAATGAVAVLLTTSADLSWKAFLIAVGGATLPVIQRWLDPTDPLGPSPVEPDPLG
jgi:hypothetical protein